MYRYSQALALLRYLDPTWNPVLYFAECVWVWTTYHNYQLPEKRLFLIHLQILPHNLILADTEQMVDVPLILIEWVNEWINEQTSLITGNSHLGPWFHPIQWRGSVMWTLILIFCEFSLTWFSGPKLIQLAIKYLRLFKCFPTLSFDLAPVAYVCLKC